MQNLDSTKQFPEKTAVINPFRGHSYWIVMTWITIIGLLAAAATTIAFLPQTIKSWKTRKTGDLSLPMYLIMVTGGFLWLTYGLLISDLPLIAANVITLSLTMSTLYLKIRYK